MAEIYHEDLFQRIVNVGWPRGGTVFFAIQAGGSDASFPAYNLNAGGISIGDLFGAAPISTRYATTTPVYRQSGSHSTTQTITIWNVQMEFSGGVWAPIHAWVIEFDSGSAGTDFANWIWDGSTGTVFNDGHEGTLHDTSADGVVAKIHHEFGDTTAALRLGDIVYGPTPHTTTSSFWEVHAMVALNLRALQKDIGGSPLLIDFIGPALFGSSWDAQIFTFRAAINPLLIPPGANNTPGATCAALAQHSATETSHGTGAVGNVDFIVNTKTLDILT